MVTVAVKVAPHQIAWLRGQSSRCTLKYINVMKAVIGAYIWRWLFVQILWHIPYAFGRFYCLMNFYTNDICHWGGCKHCVNLTVATLKVPVSRWNDMWVWFLGLFINGKYHMWPSGLKCCFCYLFKETLLWSSMGFYLVWCNLITRCSTPEVNKFTNIANKQK